MLDRQKLEAILVRRFPGASIGQVAAAANAIMGLGEEWEEIVEAPTCTAARSRDGDDLRIFRRRTAGVPVAAR